MESRGKRSGLGMTPAPRDQLCELRSEGAYSRSRSQRGKARTCTWVFSFTIPCFSESPAVDRLYNQSLFTGQGGPYLEPPLCKADKGSEPSSNWGWGFRCPPAWAPLPIGPLVGSEGLLCPVWVPHVVEFFSPLVLFRLLKLVSTCQGLK